MELTSRDKDYYSNNISISSSENIELSLSDNMGSSATLPSSYDSNDDSVKDIQVNMIWLILIRYRHSVLISDIDYSILIVRNF